ncbi:MAG: divalent metal cation transporter [bacterium]|nr:divalent metal cation transporter [bacterium]
MARIVGPGLVVAATGVGAGDLVAAAKAGATLGATILWAALLGAVLKMALAESVARWQLVTGRSVLDGWFTSFGLPVRIYFSAYLVLWGVLVSAALMSACGLAAHALVPQLSVAVWAVIHGVAALALVWFEGYPIVERVMRWAIGLMALTIIGTAIWHLPQSGSVVASAFVPSVPPGGTVLVAGVIGGVGGTLTLLAYGYWLREKRWRGAAWLRAARVDLSVGYLLTGAFGIAVVFLAAAVLKPHGIVVEGSTGVLQMAGMLGEALGRVGELLFLVGFWAAVASSIVGVWQGVPYILAETAQRLRGETMDSESTVSTRGRWYRGGLLLMTFPPMLLLVIDRPVWLVVSYAALGSLFMPFLAITMLVMNNRKRDLGEYRNGFLANAGLVASVFLFGYLMWIQLARLLG